MASSAASQTGGAPPAAAASIPAGAASVLTIQDGRLGTSSTTIAPVAASARAPAGQTARASNQIARRARAWAAIQRGVDPTRRAHAYARTEDAIPTPADVTP